IWSKQLGHAAQFVDRAIDCHRADTSLQFCEVTIDPIGGHIAGGLGIAVNTFHSFNVVEEVSIAPDKVAASDVLHMGCGAPSPQAFGRPARAGPGRTVKFDPYQDNKCRAFAYFAGIIVETPIAAANEVIE